MPQALDGPVVEVDVGHLEVARTLHVMLVALDGKAVILGRNQNPSRLDVLDRMISAAMAIRHFGCRSAEAET